MGARNEHLSRSMVHERGHESRQMTLKTLLQWAINNDIPLDYELVAGDHHSDTSPLRSMKFNHLHKQILLSDGEATEKRILEVITQTRTTRDRAISYLEKSNWNVPLAIVTYQRENP